MRAEFKERLEEALAYRRVSPAQLSEMTGISRSSISRYLSGAYDAGQNNTYLIAKALNVDAGWLAGGDCPMFPSKSDDFTISFSDHEIQLVRQYRNADDEKRRLISYLLGISEK